MADATKQITKNLGGDRLGSGSKMNIDLHAYNRSTHDLSRAWRSSMTVGTLVPFLHEVALNGDTWSIDLETLVRTIPTIGPLYGSYKLQLDVFSCPMRLYNGLLHNNMVNIGLNMSQVKLPKIELKHRVLNPLQYTGNKNQSQISSSALLNYLGISGICDVAAGDPSRGYVDVKRKFNAIPILAYYEIYKNYYANKQEEKGVIIAAKELPTNEILHTLTAMAPITGGQMTKNFLTPAASTPPGLLVPTGDTYQELDEKIALIHYAGYKMESPENWNIGSAKFVVEEKDLVNQTTTYTEEDIADVFPSYHVLGTEIILGEVSNSFISTTNIEYYIMGITYNAENNYTSEINLEVFDLENIDKARIEILKATGLNNEVDITQWTDVPYTKLTVQDTAGRNPNINKMQGLAIKTYQSDIYNNWLQTEWIDGTNGINTITAIDVSSGTFTIDALNLANKVYNMLNRIAVSGGTYEDWQEAVYSTEAVRRAETPIYMGGLSAEIVFEEVISTAETSGQPLGSLAGKGTQSNKRGGHIEIKVDEPSYIMGICSITPRVDYSQGNAWDMTELDTIDDLHKPALDGIGFQDLLQERMAWWGTYYSEAQDKFIKLAAGKIPAWLHYMTAINETHGDFAEENNCMFMTLNRRYENYENVNASSVNMGIKDLTTYIDPTKYNYSFADTTLEAQNFWVQIGMKIECRRVMSAKVMPQL